MKQVIDKVEYKECDRCSGTGKIAIVYSHTEAESEKKARGDGDMEVIYEEVEGEVVSLDGEEI
jgi:hypothetical protein